MTAEASRPSRLTAARLAPMVGLVAIAACSSRDHEAAGAAGTGGSGGSLAGAAGVAGGAPARCGDAKVDPGEQCDDGNLKAGDGCNAQCETECLGGALRDAVTGHCYAILLESRTFEGARKTCQSMASGGDLAVFEDEAELKRFQALLPSAGHFLNGTWIGARTTTAGPQWVNGAPWQLPKSGPPWSPGEPNGAGPMFEFPGCTRVHNGLFGHPDAGWSDYPCDFRATSICEFPDGVILKCQDGRVTFPEQCDSGPGCDDSCALKCGPGEVGFALTGSCYRLDQTKRSWSTAKSYCTCAEPLVAGLCAVETGAELAAINSDVEQRWCEQFLHIVPEVWLGGSQTTPSGGEIDPGAGWKWPNGAQIDSTGSWAHWASKEPNDGGDGPGGAIKENCLEFTLANGGAWNDRDCSQTQAFLCERMTQWKPIVE